MLEAFCVDYRIDLSNSIHKDCVAVKKCLQVGEER